MKWISLFFSFDGRINRLPYWLVGGFWVALAFLAIPLWMMRPVGRGVLPDVIVLGVLMIPALISCLAVGVKRLHDRDKSGWWLLFFYGAPAVLDQFATETFEWSPSFIMQLLSLAISLWMIIELGFMPGSFGVNRFGPDPLLQQRSARSETLN